MELKKKRTEWIDIAKALGIISVLCFHALPDGYYRNLLGQFHLPLFAFLSGIVFNSKYADNSKMLLTYTKKKIVALYIPFVGYNMVFLLFHNLLYRIHFIGAVNGNSLYNLKDFLKKAIAIITMGGGESLSGQLWYLIMAFEFTIIFAIILYLVKKIDINILRFSWGGVV